MEGFDANLKEDPNSAQFEVGAWRRVEVTSQEHPEPYIQWRVCPPCGHLGHLASPQHPSTKGTYHTVIENADGTITVDPSIECVVEGCTFHGFLKSGVWS